MRVGLLGAFPFDMSNPWIPRHAPQAVISQLNVYPRMEMLTPKSTVVQRVEACFRLMAQRLSEDVTTDVTQEIFIRRALSKMAGGKLRDLETVLIRRASTRALTPVAKAELATSMRTAAEVGKLGLLINLLDQYEIPIDASCQNTQRTALHLAASNGHLDVVKALLDRGASTAATDSLGRTVLHHSIRESSSACLEFLLGLDDNVNKLEDKEVAVPHDAISERNTEALKTSVDCYKKQTISARRILTKDVSRLPGLHTADEALKDCSALFSRGYSVHDRDARGFTPVYYAAKACSLESVKLLLGYGLDVSSVTQDGSSLLHLAADSESSKRHSMLKYLIEKGLSPFLARFDGITPIDILIGKIPARELSDTSRESLQMLVQWRDPDPSVHPNFSQILPRLCQGDLIYGSLWLSAALLTLVQNGADLAKQNEAGVTAVRILIRSWVAQFSNTSDHTVRDYFRGADHIPTTILTTAFQHVPTETLSDSYDDLPSLLLSALWFADEPLTKTILELCPDVDCDACIWGDQQFSVIAATCLYNCPITTFKAILKKSKAASDNLAAMKLWETVIQVGRIDLAALVLRAGVNLNSLSVTGKTPLMSACEQYDINMVVWLIANGSDVNASDRDGWNAAHRACRTANLEAIRILRTTGINWHAKVHTKPPTIPDSEVTLLHLAVMNANVTLTKYLIDEGLVQNLNCTSSIGLTPLHYAAWANNLATVELLLSMNVMISVSFDKQSPLHFVAMHGSEEMYSLFTSHGCDPSIPNGYGLDCETIAWSNGHKKLAERIAVDKGKATQSSNAWESCLRRPNDG